MGMTIDEAIKYYLNKNIVLTEEEALANTIALNTMRKYQKIRTEIEKKLDSHGNISLYNKAINDVLQIIDKYRAEEEKV